MRVMTGIIVALLTVTAWAAGPTVPKKMQCWTDSTGKRACGDRVPPEYAKGERQQLDKQGRVIGTKAREKTPEEVAAADLKLKAEQAEKERQIKQSAYDKYLLQTYSSVAEMQGVRDSRLASADGRLKLAEKSIVENEATLKALRSRVEALTLEGKPASPRLEQQIKTFEAALVDGLKVASQLKVEREQILVRFTEDIGRFRRLRAKEIQVGSAPIPTAEQPAEPSQPTP